MVVCLTGRGRGFYGVAHGARAVWASGCGGGSGFGDPCVRGRRVGPVAGFPGDQQGRVDPVLHADSGGRGLRRSGARPQPEGPPGVGRSVAYVAVVGVRSGRCVLGAAGGGGPALGTSADPGRRAAVVRAAQADPDHVSSAAVVGLPSGAGRGCRAGAVVCDQPSNVAGPRPSRPGGGRRPGVLPAAVGPSIARTPVGGRLPSVRARRADAPGAVAVLSPCPRNTRERSKSPRVRVNRRSSGPGSHSGGRRWCGPISPVLAWRPS